MKGWLSESWRDTINVAAAVATIVAAVLAFLAIRHGNRQSDRSLRAIAAERRTAFELDALRRIRKVLPIYSDGSRETVAASLGLIPHLALPYVSAHSTGGVDDPLPAEIFETLANRPNPELSAYDDALMPSTGKTVRDTLEQEVDALIKAALSRLPLEDRPSGLRRVRSWLFGGS
jgi:hypothetical protein